MMRLTWRGPRVLRSVEELVMTLFMMRYFQHHSRLSVFVRVIRCLIRLKVRGEAVEVGWS